MREIERNVETREIEIEKTDEKRVDTTEVERAREIERAVDTSRTERVACSTEISEED